MHTSSKRILKSIGFAAGASLLAVALSAAPRNDTAAVADESLAASASISGEISSINAAAKSFAIKNARSGETATVITTTDTFIMVDGKTATLASLKVGQTAVVTTETKEGRMVASSISARSADSRSGAPSMPAPGAGTPPPAPTP